MDEILTTSQGTKKTPSPIGLGARLKSARENMRLSEKEAATRLHLNARLISIMENERFTDGPPATFIRGYLRSYGRLLNLNEEEINDAIQKLNIQLTPQTTLVPPVAPPQKPLALDRYLKWSSYMVISLLFVLVVLWWTSHPRFNEVEVISKQLAQTSGAEQPVTITPPAPTAATPQPAQVALPSAHELVTQAMPSTLATATPPAKVVANPAAPAAAPTTVMNTATPPAAKIIPQANNIAEEDNVDETDESAVDSDNQEGIY